MHLCMQAILQLEQWLYWMLAVLGNITLFHKKIIERTNDQLDQKTWAWMDFF